MKSFKALADGKDVFIVDNMCSVIGYVYNHQVALRANFKIYSRSAKGGEKGNPNRNPWLAKMLPYVLHTKKK
jgi:hypothetical protein